MTPKLLNVNYLARKLGFVFFILLLCCIFFLGKSWKEGKIVLETDILKLLPQNENSLRNSKIRDNFLKRFGQSHTILFHHPDENQLSEAVTKYKSLLNNEKDCFSILEFSDYFLNSSITELSLYKENLVSSNFQSKIEKSATSFLSDRAIRILSAPSTGGISSTLKEDPLFLTLDFIQNLPDKITDFEMENGFLSKIVNDKKYLILTIEFKKNIFDRKAQNKFSKFLETYDQGLLADYSNLKIHHLGAIRFAEEAASTAESDLKIVSIISIACALLISFFSFRAFLPILLTLISVLTGLGFGLATTLLCFGKIHAVALSFGASLTGVCTDYSFHYFYHHNKKDAWNTTFSVYKPLLLGALTSIIGFLGLILVPFPGLNQMAVFSIAGMLSSCLFVLLIYPSILSYFSNSKHICQDLKFLSSSVLKINAFYLKLLFPLILFLGLLSNVFLKTDDNVKNFSFPSDELLKEQESFGSMLSNFDKNRFFASLGDTCDKALENEIIFFKNTSINNDLDKETYKISDFLPSDRTQSQTFKAFKANLLNSKNQLIQSFVDIGYSENLIKSYFKDLNNKSFTPLSIENFLKTSLGKKLNNFVLKLDKQCVALALVSKDAKKNVIPTNKNTISFDLINDASTIVSNHRVKISYLIGLFYLLVLATLIFKYGIMRGLKAILPVLIASSLVFISIVVFQLKFNIFHLLALCIVLGLAVDYSIFAEEDRESTRSLNAIFLSALTTITSFGPLLLCSSPVLKSFGLVIVAGVLSAFLTILVIYSPKRDN